MTALDDYFKAQKAARDAEWKEHGKERQAAKDAELCQHMKELIEKCKELGVEFAGCGDCGSPWLTCNTCKGLIVEYADDIFDSKWA